VFCYLKILVAKKRFFKTKMITTSAHFSCITPTVAHAGHAAEPLHAVTSRFPVLKMVAIASGKPQTTACSVRFYRFRDY
jgi:hypothetical protein